MFVFSIQKNNLTKESRKVTIFFGRNPMLNVEKMREKAAKNRQKTEFTKKIGEIGIILNEINKILIKIHCISKLIPTFTPPFSVI